MRGIAREALSTMLSVAITAAVVAAVIYAVRHVHEFSVRAELSYGPADPAAWQVAQVIEEAREITRRAAEDS